MLTTTLKIILQILTILSFGYLAIAFFQKLFCKDIQFLNYQKIIAQRKAIWQRFRRAVRSTKYKSFILLCFLCLFGFYNSLHELSKDWQLRDKLILWQIWNILFCYAVYLSHQNMKLKFIYDITGRDPKKQATIIPMETNTVQLKQQLTQQVNEAINYKKAFKYILVVLVIAIACSGYAFWAMNKAEKEFDRQKDYSTSRDSVILANQKFQDSINNVINFLKQERDSLLIIRTAKSLEREDILKKPIDYSNESERKEILDQLLKESK